MSGVVAILVTVFSFVYLIVPPTEDDRDPLATTALIVAILGLIPIIVAFTKLADIAHSLHKRNKVLSNKTD